MKFWWYEGWTAKNQGFLTTRYLLGSHDLADPDYQIHISCHFFHSRRFDKNAISSRFDKNAVECCYGLKTGLKGNQAKIASDFDSRKVKEKTCKIEIFRNFRNFNPENFLNLLMYDLPHGELLDHFLLVRVENALSKWNCSSTWIFTKLARKQTYSSNLPVNGSVDNSGTEYAVVVDEGHWQRCQARTMTGWWIVLLWAVDLQHLTGSLSPNLPNRPDSDDLKVFSSSVHWFKVKTMGKALFWIYSFLCSDIFPRNKTRASHCGVGMATAWIVSKYDRRIITVVVLFKSIGGGGAFPTFGS